MTASAGLPLLLIHLLCPLFFFTDLVRNPYVLQIHALQGGLLAVSAVWLLLGFRRDGWSWRSSPLFVPLVVFAGLAFLSWGVSWLSHEPFRPSIAEEGKKAHFFLWVNGLVPFFWAVQAAGTLWERRIRGAILFVGLAASLYGLAQYFGWEPFWPQALNPYSGRPVSTFGNPNFLSSYLVMLFPLGLDAFFSTRSDSARVGWAAMLLVFAGALTCTMTRSSWIGALVAVAVYLFRERRLALARRREAVLLGAIVLSAVIFWPASRSEGAVRPLHRLVELARCVTVEKSYGSWHQRLLIWSCARDMALERPLFGKGWGAFELFYPFYQGSYMGDAVLRGFRTHANNAHNVLLEISSQAGFLGLGAFLWLCAVAGKASASPGPGRSAPAAAVAGMLADNFFGNVSLFFAVPALLFFWSLGLMSAGDRRGVLPLNPFFAAAAVGLILLSSAGIHRSAAHARAEVSYFEGYKRAHRGDLPGAVRFLEDSRRFRPYEVNNNYELGNVFLRQARAAAREGLALEPSLLLEKAVQAYDAALAANAGYDEIYFNKASALLALGRVDEAESSLKTSILINPIHPPAYRALEALYRQSGRVPLAEDLLRREKSFR